jgi:hypothetical protein
MDMDFIISEFLWGLFLLFILSVFGVITYAVHGKKSIEVILGIALMYATVNSFKYGYFIPWILGLIGLYIVGCFIFGYMQGKRKV